MALVLVCIAMGPAMADEVTITGAPVYVTRSDCRALVAFQPSPDVAYKPGVDVHGKYVAPADLPDAGFAPPPTDHVAFELKLNPLSYGGAQGLGTHFGQTTLPAGRVVVDTKTGEATYNGRPLDSGNTRILRQACNKAGYR